MIKASKAALGKLYRKVKKWKDLGYLLRDTFSVWAHQNQKGLCDMLRVYEYILWRFYIYILIGVCTFEVSCYKVC
jgi:hypothetical protein